MSGMGREFTSGMGDCYHANGQLFVNETLFPGDKKGWLLVHGEVAGQGPLEGIKYGHCWIEDGGTVIDQSNGNNVKMSKKAYYALGQIGDNVIKYKPEQVRKKILQTEHWGSWNPNTSTGL
jgi:hypothetical protein